MDLNKGCQLTRRKVSACNDIKEVGDHWFEFCFNG